MSLVFAGHRCCDHSPSSGYDQVCALFPEAGWLSGPELVAGRLTWLREPATVEDHASSMFHVFYGDCSGSSLPAILRERFPRAVIVSTVHQPITRLAQDPAGWAALSAVDAIITVSHEQARELTGRGLTVPMQVVPHGVWTHVFRPSPAPRPVVRDSVLMVGNYLRDWNGTRQIVEMLATSGVRSVVLGSAVPSRLFIDNPMVEVSARVSEADLAASYDNSAALVLPVLDATASNALLEAMAAGCPVICPRLPSLVNEYLGDDTDAYQPGRYDQAVARTLTYIHHPERRAERSHTLMARAGTLDWARLRPRLAAAYEQIVNRASVLNGVRP